MQLPSHGPKGYSSSSHHVHILDRKKSSEKGVFFFFLKVTYATLIYVQSARTLIIRAQLAARNFCILCVCNIPKIKKFVAEGEVIVRASLAASPACSLTSDLLKSSFIREYPAQDPTHKHKLGHCSTMCHPEVSKGPCRADPASQHCVWELFG